MEVKNRFKELDLMDRVPEELCMEARNIVQEAATKSIPPPKKGNARKHSGCPVRPYKSQRRETKCKGDRESYRKLNADFQKIARRDKRAFLNEQCKEI